MALLKLHWGFDALRPHQAEVMRADVEGRDSLVVMRTGAGKSLCFQVPALLREGVTIVVSPLVSLMQDQIEALQARGVPASHSSSTMLNWQRKQAEEGLREGKFKLFYVAPEKLVQEGFLDILRSIKVEAFAVDEAHCIPQWGKNFRKDYTGLGDILEAWSVPVRAFTATATVSMQETIRRELRLKNPVLVSGDTGRPNLSYGVVQRHGKLGLDQLMELIEKHPNQCGIVYCLARKDTEKIAEALAAQGVSCRRYHAGLSAKERDEAFTDFMSGRVDVMVATVAFGMGIDKPDVRFVVHVSLPHSLVNYIQETGRAGRDGEPSDCVMLCKPSDYGRAIRLHDASDRSLAEGKNRLHEMMGYAAGVRCRRALIEEGISSRPSAMRCGSCDVCRGELQPLSDSVEVARRLLRGVLETGQWFGSKHVVHVLLGRSTKEIRKWRHDEASCHGSLDGQGHAADALIAYLEQMTAQGLLVNRNKRFMYRVLQLTTAGRELLQGAGGDVQLLHHASMDTGAGAMAAARKRASSKKASKKASKKVVAHGGPQASAAQELDAYRTMLARAKVAPQLELKARIRAEASRGGPGAGAAPEPGAGELEASAAQKLEAYRAKLARAKVAPQLERKARIRAEAGLPPAPEPPGLELEVKMHQRDRWAPVGAVAEVRASPARSPAGLESESESDEEAALQEPAWQESGDEAEVDPTLRQLRMWENLEARLLKVKPMRHKEQPTAADKKAEREKYDGDPLTARLRELRARLASEGSVPPYFIFTDRTLYDIVKQRPSDQKGLRAVYGLGPVKVSQYGHALLEEIAKS